MRLSILPFLSFLSFPFDALGPRGGPYFLLLQKVGKDRRKGVSPPCESPDQSGVLDAPLWKPPSPRWRGRPGRTPRRLRGWSFGAVGESASACALATAAAPPPLRGGGLRPLAPQGSQTGTFACHARMRMVPRPKRLLRRSLRKSPGSSCRAAARSSVKPRFYSLFWRANCGRRPRQRDRRGESQRGRSPLWPVFAYFLLARK